MLRKVERAIVVQQEQQVKREELQAYARARRGQRSGGRRHQKQHVPGLGSRQKQQAEHNRDEQGMENVSWVGSHGGQASHGSQSGNRSRNGSQSGSRSGSDAGQAERESGNLVTTSWASIDHTTNTIAQHVLAPVDNNTPSTDMIPPRPKSAIIPMTKASANDPFGEYLRVAFGELPGRGFPVKQAQHERGGVGGGTVEFRQRCYHRTVKLKL